MRPQRIKEAKEEIAARYRNKTSKEIYKSEVKRLRSDYEWLRIKRVNLKNKKIRKKLRRDPNVRLRFAHFFFARRYLRKPRKLLRNYYCIKNDLFRNRI